MLSNNLKFHFHISFKRLKQTKCGFFPNFLSTYAFNKYYFLEKLGLKEENLGCWNGKEWVGNGSTHISVNPSTGEKLASIQLGDEKDYEACISSMQEAQLSWMMTPAPKRGEIIRQIGVKLRDNIEDLGMLVSLEVGKVISEGIGEVQEFIDICDLAVGMSRQLPGNVFTSERVAHTLIETWNPLGKVGIITAFNFPCAVHGWNAAVSLVCGNTQIWKGSVTTSLVSIAQTKIITDVLLENHIHGGVATLCLGEGSMIGEKMIGDPRLNLISFTGSTKNGKKVAAGVATRLGRTILELGGNNAIIVMEDADLEAILDTVLFAAVGTSGQRCTTLRRLILHESIYDKFLSALSSAYSSLKPGNPLLPGTLLGPLHTASAVDSFLESISEVKRQGGKILCGGSRIDVNVLKPLGLELGNYVWPTLVESHKSMPIVYQEIFGPLTHVLKVKSFEEAVELNNSTGFGLSSSIFTNNLQHAFQWLGPLGSDCGIVNINTSCSGAEIGGAFGGEKDTGGGRESGSDSWKQYMRRSTCAINYGSSIPLAQGITFSVKK